MKNLVFDLGGVIIPLDTSLVNQSLRQINPHATALDLHAPFFLQYEVGKISCEAFRQAIRQHSNSPALTDAEVERIWNSLLLPIPAERVRRLQDLVQRHRLFLLSNTNEIHLKRVNELLQEATGLPNLEAIFERAYYSHRLQARKPDAEIYERMLADLGLPAESAIFIDDNRDNAEGATAVGMQGIWLDLSQQTMLDLAFE